jgi:beta-galactosidase
LIGWPLQIRTSRLSAAEFKVRKSDFSLDDKPFQIRAGEILYSRVPRADWRSRIQMAKAMGLNTNSTYVFWNYHETQAGEFDFKGEKMIMGQREALPGQPDFCAEFWVGWFDTWVRPRSAGMHHRMTGDLGWMMRNGGCCR